MILANGCNITKSEKIKGVWILSVPTVCLVVTIKYALKDQMLHDGKTTSELGLPSNICMLAYEIL